MRAKYEHVDLADRGSLVMLDVAQPIFEKTWHFHPEVELTHIISGRGERFVGASIEPFEPDDLVLLGKNTPHYWNSEDVPNTDQSVTGPQSQATVFQFEESLVDSFV
jgi:mannose-6-phosphate isomerase-like protein (cupin superfamily)